MEKVRAREVRLAWTRFDRATAYGCAQRHVVYDAAIMCLAWNKYREIMGPMPAGYHYGDTRD